MSRDLCRCRRDMSPIGYFAPFFTAKMLHIRIRAVSGWSLRPSPFYISVPARCSLCPLYAVLDARFSVNIALPTGQERFRSMVRASRKGAPNYTLLTGDLQAPIYYRGANAAIIMYDLTRLESFDDVRMWLEGMLSLRVLWRYVDSTIPELRKNADFPELAIYIVGSKVDLRTQRQVTPDRARQALHRWFPPPRRPSPPPTPIPTPSQSLASYIRPRFTSITSYGATSSGSSSGSAHRGPGPATNLARANTVGGLGGVPPSSRPNGARHNSLHSVDAMPNKALLREARSKSHQREKSWAGTGHPPTNLAAFSFPNLLGASKPEWDPKEAEEDSFEEEEEPEWGLGTNMHLFEVSAKDSSGMPPWCEVRQPLLLITLLGIQDLFDTVIAELLERRHEIIATRRERERDSVMLHNTSWGALAEEEEAKARDQRQGWSCC